MALELLRNKIYTFAARNKTFALTASEMLNLDSTSRSYSLEYIKLILTSSLQAYSISVVQDTTQNALVFIPNARTLNSLITNLAPAPVYTTPVVNVSPPAVYNQPIYSSVNAFARFTGNPNQYLYRSMVTSALATSCLSFWFKGNINFYIGAVDDNTYPINIEYANIYTIKGLLYAQITQRWRENGYDYTGSDSARLLRIYPNFNHIVFDFAYHRLYLNGQYIQMTHSGGYKPTINQNGKFIIGQYKYSGQRYGSICNIKNVALFQSSDYNNTFIDDIYAYGENGNIGNIGGLTLSNYWKLNGNGTDAVTGITLTSSGVTYGF